MRRRSAIVLSGSLAILGGLLILASGARTQSFMLDAVLFVYQREGSVIPTTMEPLIKDFILVLSAIILLGGLLAVVGGFTIFEGHLTAGKILVALGGGIGFAGIAFLMGYDIYAYGFSVLISRIDYWIGVLLATVARYVAKDAS
ncbi:MAG: hypothetical protein ACRECH_15485 [Nitrososphaerales archaeon]